MDDTLKPFGSIAIVGVQPADNFAGRSSKTFIQRLTLTAIFLRNPKHLLLVSILRLATQQIDGSVSRYAIYYQVLPVLIVLKSDTRKRLTDIIGLIEGRSDDGDKGCVFHEMRVPRYCHVRVEERTMPTY